MTNKQSLRPNGFRTDKTYQKAHGGYRNLKSYQTATFIYDLTVEFCRTYLNRSDPTNQSYRTVDQMIQAARSGRQNIAEGSQASAVSKKTEIKLVGVARASLEELLIDYEDFLRQRGFRLWEKDSPEARQVRALCYRSDTTYQQAVSELTSSAYRTYQTYLQTPEAGTNCLICLIHQANYLLDKQLESLKQAFIKEGGFTENLFKERLRERRK